MNTFTLYWRHGEREIVEGDDAADAMTRAGYGGGAVAALDFYARGDNTDYQFNKDEYCWEWTPEYKAKVASGVA